MIDCRLPLVQQFFKYFNIAIDSSLIMIMRNIVSFCDVFGHLDLILTFYNSFKD